MFVSIYTHIPLNFYQKQPIPVVPEPQPATPHSLEQDSHEEATGVTAPIENPFDDDNDVSSSSFEEIEKDYAADHDENDNAWTSRVASSIYTQQSEGRSSRALSRMGTAIEEAIYRLTGERRQQRDVVVPPPPPPPPVPTIPAMFLMPSQDDRAMVGGGGLEGAGEGGRLDGGRVLQETGGYFGQRVRRAMAVSECSSL